MAANSRRLIIDSCRSISAIIGRICKSTYIYIYIYICLTVLPGTRDMTTVGAN